MKNFVPKKKVVPLHRQTKTTRFDKDFGLWCNGNTTDSGPVFLGSSPSSPTVLKRSSRRGYLHWVMV